jgi:hypothetical protein
MGDETHREFLQRLEVQSQSAFDKSVMALSGGALGLSFAFVADIVPLEGAAHIAWLLLAWGAWAISVACVLASHIFSTLALRKEIESLDREEDNAPARRWDRVTAYCNAAGGLLFVAGVFSVATFVCLNLGGS